MNSAPDVAEKALRQLQKAEITYDRLALFNRSGETMPYHPVLIILINILDLLRPSHHNWGPDSFALISDDSIACIVRFALKLPKLRTS